MSDCLSVCVSECLSVHDDCEHGDDDDDDDAMGMMVMRMLKSKQLVPGGSVVFLAFFWIPQAG